MEKGNWIYEETDYPELKKEFKTKEDALFHAMCSFGFSIRKKEDNE